MAGTHTLSLQSKIAVLYGGMSAEREVSLRSGKNCFDALQRLGYENSFLLDVGTDVAEQLKKHKPDMAFLALHGTYGEDGCIQGVLEILNIPYTGCNVAASALTWNKASTKTILAAAGLPILPSVTVNSKSSSHNLEYPVMIKPLAEGSSYGMSKVDSPDQLQSALEEAGRYGADIMIESYLVGKSITVGVIDIDGKPTVTPILEMRPTESEWYDLEAKYTPGKTQFILPAEISPAVTKQIQDITLKAHKAAGCHGVSRTDFVVSSKDESKFYILEINTIPGMTDLSDLPAQAKAMGVSYDQLVEHILKTALTRSKTAAQKEALPQ